MALSVHSEHNIYLTFIFYSSFRLAGGKLKHFSFPKRPDRLWGSPSLLFVFTDFMSQQEVGVIVPSQWNVSPSANLRNLGLRPGIRNIKCASS